MKILQFPIFLSDRSTSTIEHITWFRISVTAKLNNSMIIFYDTKKEIICAISQNNLTFPCHILVSDSSLFYFHHKFYITHILNNPGMLTLSKIVSEIHSLDVPHLNYLDNFIILLYFHPAKIFITEFVNSLSLNISDLRYDFLKYIFLIITKN